MIGCILPHTEPAFNLALEDVLFSQLNADSPGYFLLWQNAPSIIVGRHQNTHEEINPSLCQRYALDVVRRQTGGGAVYHDLGNLNFSFLVPDTERGPLDFARFLKPIQEVLHTMGVDAQLSSRNDLTVGGLKISGSAQLRNKQGILHHGTLLFSLDLDMLGAVLTGAPDKFLSKGIASVRSRVTNICEHAPSGTSLADLQNQLMRHCSTSGSTDFLSSIKPELLTAAEALAATKYRTWDWNFGASPAFTHKWRQRFSWGALEVCYAVQRGHIVSCRLYGDYFSQADIPELEAVCVGLPYQRSSLGLALGNIPFQQYFNGCDPREVLQFLLAEINM